MTEPVPASVPTERRAPLAAAGAPSPVAARDYVRVSPRPDARTVIEQLPVWLAHYNEVHPHRALGYRSPREYITQIREAPSDL